MHEPGSARHRNSRAQHGEDLVLAEMLGNRRGGTYVEAGALDGERLSNTWYFEHELGWSGLLVEPIPQLADLCRQKRPGSTTLQAALGKSQGTARLTIPSSDPAFATTMGHAHLGLRHVAAEVANLDVPQLTLDAALQAAEIDRLDLVILDVEDAEHHVLAGFDLRRFAPSVVMLERDYIRPSVVVRLVRSGYAFRVRVGTNDIWTAEGSRRVRAQRCVVLFRIGIKPTLKAWARMALAKLHLLTLVRRVRQGRPQSGIH